MVHASLSESQSTFWAAIAQIVPVLLLALIIEARRSAKMWTVEDRSVRRIESALLTITALMLLNVFMQSVAALGGHSDPPSQAAVLIQVYISVFLLVVNPVYLLFMRANADIVMHVVRFVRFVLFWRKRRDLSRLAARADEITEEAREAVQLALAGRQQAIKDAESTGLLPTSALEWRTAILGDHVHPEMMSDLKIANLDELVAQYDRSPSPVIASRLRRMNVWQAGVLSARANQYLAEIQTYKAQLSEILQSRGYGALSEKEIDRLRKNIELAGDDFFIMLP